MGTARQLHDVLSSLLSLATLLLLFRVSHICAVPRICGNHILHSEKNPPQGREIEEHWTQGLCILIQLDPFVFIVSI